MKKKMNGRPYAAQDLSLFCSQVALLLRSGMFLPDGMEALAEESDDPVLTAIAEEVREKGSLAPALEKTGAFPEYLIGMVELGESSGKLEEVMTSLSEYYEREQAVRRQVKTAVLYPMVLVLMMIVVIAVLLIKVLPVFSQVFRDLGADASVMTGGTVAGYIALGIAAVIAVLCIALFVMVRSAEGYAKLTALMAKFRPTRSLAEKIAAGRFAFALSLLLESGYDLDTALKKLPAIVESEATSKKIEVCRAAIDEGDSFSEAVNKSGLFPGMYSRILAVGFRAGALDTVSRKIAGIYEEEIDRSIAAAVSFIEPLLVALLCIVIGVILLSIMLPLTGIMSGIG
ncbi:MAG: type II secretion system F family protein [Clostridia bacterium]|nr:type II secretion system F family protein [Clostridia bacterium]MBR0026264.1 type II secretion system F family protein [Clostridia bacterium]